MSDRLRPNCGAPETHHIGTSHMDTGSTARDAASHAVAATAKA
jgi:hypothetical protein